MKKFWKYTTITLLLLIGLCAIGLLYLFFLPEKSLFGLTYKGSPTKQVSESFSSDQASTIIVNSNHFEFQVLPSSDDTIYLEIQNKTFGFTTTKRKPSSVSTRLKNNVLTFDVTETTGAVFKNDSKTILYIPANIQKNLYLSNKKAKTSISSNQIVLNEFRYSTEKGDLTLSNCEIKSDIKLSLNKATCMVEESTKTNDNKLNISLSTGALNATNSSFGDVTIDSNDRGNVRIKSCQDLFCEQDQAGGNIEIDSVKNITSFSSSDTNVKINTVEQSINNLTLTKSGKVNIGNIEGQAKITTQDGNIVVDSSKSTLYVSSTHGDITVNNAHTKVGVSNVYGNSTINFVYDETTPDQVRTLFAKLEKGNLNSKNATLVQIDVENEGTSNINLYMPNILGTSLEQNYVHSKNGSCYIKVNKQAKFRLYVKGTTSIPMNHETSNIKAQFGQFAEYGGKYLQKNHSTNYNSEGEFINYANYNEYNADPNKVDFELSNGNGYFFVTDDIAY